MSELADAFECQFCIVRGRSKLRVLTYPVRLGYGALGLAAFSRLVGWFADKSAYLK